MVAGSNRTSNAKDKLGGKINLHYALPILLVGIYIALYISIVRELNETMTKYVKDKDGKLVPLKEEPVAEVAEEKPFCGKAPIVEEDTEEDEEAHGN